MDTNLRIAVMGAGHGGKAMAAEIASRGFPVHLYNRTDSHVSEIRERGGIDLHLVETESHVFGPILKASNDIQEIIHGVQLIMVVLPASAHADIARVMSPYLEDGQVIVLNPGRTGGALEFRQVLRQTGCTADVVIGEASTFLFASRSMGPSEARLFRRKNSVPAAALPASRTPDMMACLQKVYPEFIAAPDVLTTSLDNMGAVFHPALVLLNAGWIERTQGDFEFYHDGVTETTARMLEIVDRERVTVAASLGIRARTAEEWLATAYSASGKDLNEAIHDNPGYAGIKAPRSTRHRYVFEDVPFSLVPIAELGKRFGVNVSGIDALIQLACIAHGTDYVHRGRTLDRMGLTGLRVREIMTLVQTGESEIVNPF